MNVAHLKLIITSSDHLGEYGECKYSNEKDIHVNMIDNTYIIIFTDEDIMKQHISGTLSNIRKIIVENLKDYVVNFVIAYDTQNPDLGVLAYLLSVDLDLAKEPELLYPLVYTSSDQLLVIAKSVIDANNANTQKVLSEKFKRANMPIDDDDDEDELESPYEDSLMRILYGPGGGHKGKKKSNKKKKISYSSSRVLRAASHPRRSYNRHGIIICSNKKAIKKDEDTIKDFLKDFIPGNSGWKKELRKELLKRWMSLYVITKKKSNQMQKKYRRSINKVTKKQKVDQVVDLTRRMLSVPIDSWNDPNR